MDVMLQRHCARYIYVVPDGLRELMSDISREVLRSQPEDLYTFIADYLDALLITRENARVSARFVQHMTEGAETVVDLLNRSGMSAEEADHAAEVIQEAFRTWSSRKGILKEDEEAMVARIIEDAGISELQAQEAAVCIQHAFKAFKIRQQREQDLLSGIIDWRVAARSAIKLYRRTGVSPEEAKRAANLIKAAYKGYYTRRAFKQLNEVNASIREEPLEATVAEDRFSLGSTVSDKKKGVRIDYQTVVPHVDFGDEELITPELEEAIIDDGIDEVDEGQDVMEKIFGGPRKEDDISTEAYIRDLLEECVLGPIAELKIDEVQELISPHEDKEGDEDVFETGYDENVPDVEAGAVSDDLQNELLETKKEMEALRESKQEGRISIKQSGSISTKQSKASQPPEEQAVAPEAPPSQEERPPEEAPVEEVPTIEAPPATETPVEE